MSPGLSVGPFLLAQGTLLLVLGGALMLRGFRPWRQGDAPYCAKCGYSLIGIDSQRCPECGTVISPKTTVRGKRHPRPVVGVAGLVLVLGGLVSWGVGAYAPLKQVKFYQYVPASWVMRDLRSPDQAKATKAWDDLVRRWQAGGLDASQKDRLIDLCLAEQVGPRRAGLTTRLISHLQRCCLDGVLSELQQRRFLSQIPQTDLIARPRAAYGAEVPYELRCRGGGPSRQHKERHFWVRMGSRGDLLLDGKPDTPGTFVHSGGQRATINDVFSTGSTLLSPSLKPGQHELSLPLKVSVFFGAYLDEGASRLCHQEDRLLTATFEVLRPGAGDGIRLIQHSSLRGELLKCFQRLQLHVKRPDPSRLNCCTLGAVFDPLPVGVAFDIYIRVKGKERRVGSLARPAMPEQGGYELRFWLDPPVPEMVDVILRSSKAIAQETTDVLEMWDGELVFENVPVKTD